jgi:hypothetical protein
LIRVRQPGPGTFVVDGGIDGDRLCNRAPTLIKERGEDGLLGIDAIAETFWQIHRQPRSAWTQEVDLRPFKETFWGAKRFSMHIRTARKRGCQQTTGQKDS